MGGEIQLYDLGTQAAGSIFSLEPGVAVQFLQ